MLSLLLDSFIGVSPAAAFGLIFCLLYYTDALNFGTSMVLTKGLLERPARIHAFDLI